MKLIRLRSKLDEILSYGVDMCAYEAARHAAPKMQGALVCQAEFQAAIKMWCEDNGVPYTPFSPSQIKKHATGKGNANKQAMIAAARERWPGVDFSDDNVADARWILDLAESRFCVA